MKIGFLLPANFAIGNPGNGVLAQSAYQAEALARNGHEVVRLDPWHVVDITSFDVVQFFQGGMGHYMIESRTGYRPKLLVFAPIIDSNESNFRYRLAALAGHFHRKLLTVPGVLQDQARGSDLVVCRSQHERDRLVRGLGIDPNKVHVVLNGVTLPEPTKAHSREAGLPDEFMLHVSAYTQPRKNVLRLVEAAGPLGYPLVIAGKRTPGEIEDRLLDLVARYPTVKLLGFVEHTLLHALFASCRVLCLPSLHEGTGLVALEAAVHGANVVITKFGGATDYFGPHAFYVNPYDVDNIREALVHAWQSPPSTVLRRHIADNLTWDHSAQRLSELYRHFIERKRV